MLPDFSDLNSLLASAKQQAAAKTRGADLQKKLAKGRKSLPADEIAEIEASIASWEAEQIWRPVANVALLEVCVCGKCGKESPQQAGAMMQLQELRRKTDTKRLVRAAFDPALPRQVRRVTTQIDLCYLCISQIGFPIWDETPLEAPLADGLQLPADTPVFTNS